MSGCLSMLLATGTGYVLDAQNMAASDIATAPANADAAISIDASGNVTTTVTGTDFDLLLTGAIADLEIMVTTGAGTVTTGTLDAWVALSGAGWTKTRSAVGTAEFTGSYSIRIAATGVVLVSGISFSLSVTVI